MKDTSSTLRDSSSALARMRRRCAARSSELRWCLSAVRTAPGLVELLVDGSAPCVTASGFAAVWTLAMSVMHLGASHCLAHSH